MSIWVIITIYYVSISTYYNYDLVSNNLYLFQNYDLSNIINFMTVSLWQYLHFDLLSHNYNLVSRSNSLSLLFHNYYLCVIFLTVIIVIFRS